MELYLSFQNMNCYSVSSTLISIFYTKNGQFFNNFNYPCCPCCFDQSWYGSFWYDQSEYECKKTKNRDGKPQLRSHYIDFQDHQDEFRFFHDLLADATEDLLTRKKFLPNPSDMFEGKQSIEIYRLKLIDN